MFELYILWLCIFVTQMLGVSHLRFLSYMSGTVTIPPLSATELIVDQIQI